MTIVTASATDQLILDNEVGQDSHGGFDFEVWRSSDRAETHMLLEENGLFVCEWNTAPTRRSLFRSGRRYEEENLTHRQMGEITLTYDVVYTATSGSSFFGGFGWMGNGDKGTLVEYYIVENWGGVEVRGNDELEVYAIDGENYNLFVTYVENALHLDGEGAYTQIWAVRENRRHNGTVNVSEHFYEWERQLGIEFGGMREVSLAVRGDHGEGRAQVDLFELILGGFKVGGGQVEVTPPETAPEIEEVPDETPNETVQENTSVDPDAPAPRPAPAPAPAADVDNANEGSNSLMVILAGVVAVGVVAAAVGSVNLKKR